MGLDQQFLVNDRTGRQLSFTLRKANQIHNWIETNVGLVENCENKEISIEQLEQLRDDCETVLKDHDKAQEILPTTSGFFFGSLEYDEWYFNDVEYTKKSLDNILRHKDDIEGIWYWAWW